MKLNRKTVYAIMLGAAALIVALGLLQAAGVLKLADKLVGDITSGLLLVAAVIFVSYRQKENRAAHEREANAAKTDQLVGSDEMTGIDSDSVVSETDAMNSENAGSNDIASNDEGSDHS